MTARLSVQLTILRGVVLELPGAVVAAYIFEIPAHFSVQSILLYALSAVLMLNASDDDNQMI